MLLQLGLPVTRNIKLEATLLKLSKSSGEPAIRLRNIGKVEEEIDARSFGGSSRRKRAIESRV